ncbi:hypothetical protein F4805DRAFT_470101 [Annulohypoxylon moriforme]|nr:hypothetical protein F4805DRAFT_470101 [Annulohypoxylon moriforme]
MSSRNTRAKSRANAENGTPGSRQPYSEPPSADLPSLYPMHDGSYGVNTHVNLDNVRRRRGRKPGSDLVNEDDEDRRFTRRMRGRDGSRFNMENDLQKVAEETVEEARRDEGANEDPDEQDDIWLDPSLHTQGARPGALAGSYQADRGATNEETGNGEDLDSESEAGRNSILTGYIPTLSGQRFYPNPDNRGRPTRVTTRYRSAEPDSLIHNREPSVPVSAQTPFFGPSSGIGYPNDSTSFRPGSAKSFIGEGTLYGDASVYTPQSQDSSRNPIPRGLSPEEWSIVSNFIQGMRRPPPPTTASRPREPVKPLNHLSPAEIQATRSLIRDMGKDPATVASIIDELDKAAKLVGPPKSSTGGIFGNQHQQPPPVPGAVPINVPGPLVNNLAGTSGLAPGPREKEGGADGEDINFDRRRPVQKQMLKPAIKSSPITKPQNIAGPQSARPSRRKRDSWTGLTKWIADKWDAILVFLTILTGVWVFLTFVNNGPQPLGDEILNAPGIQWPQWDTVRANVLQGGANAGGGIPGDAPSQVAENLVENVAPRIPEQVFVQRDNNGRLKISQDFWHALRELIRGDDIILTLQQARREAPGISDAHWTAIRNRLRESGLLNPQPPPNTGGGHPVVEDPKRHCDECWSKWISKNQEALRRAVSGVAVTRDEFMTLFRQEAKSYAQTMNDAFTNVNEQITQLQNDVARLRDKAQDSPNISKGEIQKVCDAAVKKAIRDIKLNAILDGQQRGHANDLFVNQVNFFGVGSGAVIDPTYSSKPWEIPKGYFKPRSKQWYQRDGWRTQPVSQALSPWSEEGECFCAGPKAWGLREETASVHNLVVEHILPGSTLDPGAMPRHIEVWAYIEEMTLRDEVRVFSTTNFPPTGPEKTLNEAYLKVGHFEYERKEAGDGIQVFKLSDELAQMRAHTSSIVIRAISNYGADHTCFYRLRMYGEVVETEPWKEWNGRE